MSMNLLALAESYFSHDVVEQVSTRLGENPRDTQTAINGALPTVLGGLIQKSTEPGGPGTLLNMVGQVMTPNRAAGEVITPEGGVFSQLGSMFDGSGTQMDQFLSMGNELITNLFGHKTDAIAGALATYSGVRQASASALLSLAGPVVLGVLGKRLATDGDGPSGLTTLLAGQVGNVQVAMPPELGSTLGAIPGMTTPGDPGSGLPRPESGIDTSPSPTVLPTATAPANRPAAGIPAYSDNQTAETGNRWLPWLLLAIGAAALFFLLRGCHTDQPATGRKSADATLNPSLKNDHHNSAGYAPVSCSCFNAA